MNLPPISPSGSQSDDLNATPNRTKPQDYGRIDADGNVWVDDAGTERMVGGYPDGIPEDPFALYVRRYLDLEATVNLFSARLPGLGARDIDSTLKILREQLVEPAAVGNLQALRDRVEDLTVLADQRKSEITAERVAAKEEALTIRTGIVEEAESIAAQPVDNTQWKQSGQRLRDLLESWKEQQRRGPRLDKQLEDGLWKRFSSARTVFDRNRRQFFAALDASQSDAKALKEALIGEAEALSMSDAWGPTSGAYRELMERWKKAGRASRKDDDALWARFRAAQQVFFDRRRANDEAKDQASAENLRTKQELLRQAEALLPIKNASRAKDKLRSIQDQWDELGHVPGRDGARIEGRLRDVEQALRDAEDREWRRSNPETQARAEGMLRQLEAQIVELEAEKAAAQAAGENTRADDIEVALSTKRAWLMQVQESIG